MKREDIEDLFKQLHGALDIEEPLKGHEKRFRDKLAASNKVLPLAKKTKKNWWKTLSVAASIALIIGVAGLYFIAPSLEDQVAGISPEVSKTEFYFDNIINEQVHKMQNERAPETKRIIEDTMLQLQKLEADHNSMEQDLLNGGNSKFILSAMIINFQTRIDLLQEVLDKIETIKTLNNSTHEDATI